jgi:hypothetical protein
MAKGFTAITKNANNNAATGFAAYSAKLRETSQIGRDDQTGELVFAFAANSERGAGGQVVPVSEMAAVIEYLKGVAENGIPSSDGGVLATVRGSIKVTDDGCYSFRTTDGQGAKPMKIATGAFADVVNEVAKIYASYAAVIADEKAKIKG